MFKRCDGSRAAMEPGTTRWGAAALLLLLVPAASQPAPAPQRYAQLVVRERIVIRVPVRSPGAAAASSAIKWEEGKGPKCVPARAIIGASLLSQNSVDLILRDRRRIRARLEDRCPALDYYHGFYITPSADGMICEDRDIIRSRMGGQCEIDRFRSLQAVRRE
jgi:hypothetical protein